MKWDKIVSIKYIGQEHVYDLEIKGTHNFLGNDILAHNTFISGNTGIGFSTPDRRLLISSDIDIVGSNASLLGTAGTQFSISGDSASGTQKKLVLGIDTTDNFAVIQAGTLGTNYALALSPAGGNVGIGTTTANATLSVVGNASIGGLYTGVSPPANGLFVNGNVGIGATDSNNRLDVWGNSRITGNLTLDGTCTGCVTPSGWTDDGTVVRLTTISDNVGIGTTSPSQRLQINFSSSNPVVVTSGGNVGIGFTTPLSLLHVQGDGSTGTWSTNSNYLPVTRRFHSSVVANGYVYVIGGGTSTGESTVYYAKLNADGSAGTWTTNSNSLPAIRGGAGSVVANGYVYVIGGCASGADTCGSSSSTIYYARINSDGSTGSWTTNSNYLPLVRSWVSSVVANGYVYVIGGTNSASMQSTIYYARINSDGSTGSWTTNSNYLPATRGGAGSVVANGYVYVIGGCASGDAICLTSSSTIYYAKLNSDGSAGTWTTNSNYLPLVRGRVSSVVANGYVYVIGGTNSSSMQSTIYYARINSDGSTGSWTTNTNYLPAVRGHHSSVIANGYVYVIGGCTTGTTSCLTPSSTIYYAPLQRVSIAGDLDLLGLTGGNVGDSTGDSSFGSVGGSVFAGNIFSAGALEVSGNTQLWSGLGVNGPVSIGVGATNPPSTLVSIQQGNLNLGTGSSAPNSLLQVAGDGSTGTWRTNTNYLPGGRGQHSSVLANGYVYVMGGQATGPLRQSTVYYARLNSDGSTGTWNTNSNYLPGVRVRHSSVVANGYVYVMGGFDGDSQSTIYYARLNSDGSTGTWNTNSNYLPGVRTFHSSVLANGYVYVIGGTEGDASTVYYAKLNSDGSVGTWSTNSNYLPRVLPNHSSVVANGYVYVIGGGSGGTSTVYYARLNSDGSTGTWSTNSNYLPGLRQNHSSIIANGYIYVIGGCTAGCSATNIQSTVFYAKLNSDGSVGTWSTNSNYLPAIRGTYSSVLANGYVYVVGGYDGTNYQSTVYYAPLARVSIAADLDLLGITGGNVGDSTGDSSLGSVGGSIFAGNIFSAGALEVSGNSQFWSGAGFNGPVNIGIGASSPATGAAFSISGNTSLTGPQLPVFNVLNNGNVGIGVSAPEALLHIASNASCLDGTDVSTVCALNDYAEIYPASQPTEKGDVVVIDTSEASAVSSAESVGSPVPSEPVLSAVEVVEGDSSEVKGLVRPSTQAYDKKIIGIVTSNPAILIEGSAIKLMGTSYQHDPYKPGVALAGRVPVKVSTENGPIEIGDYLTSSSTPGVAMKAIRPGQVVGKALEEFSCSPSTDAQDDKSCQGKIVTFVNVSWADPNNFLASLSLDNQGNLIIPKIKTGTITLDSSIATASAIPYFYDLSGKIASLEERIAALEATQTTSKVGSDSFEVDIAGESTPSASLAEQTPEVNIETSGVDQLDLTPPDILLATTSDNTVVANLTVTSSATMSGVLTAYQAQIQDHFKVLGPTTLSSTQIAGDLTIDGTLSIENGSEINVIGISQVTRTDGILYLQKSPLAQGLDILNGKVTIDRDGNLKATTISADQFKVNQGKTVGKALILAGQTEVIIENPYAQENSLILLTPNIPLLQSLQTTTSKGSFKVIISHPQPQDINFDYLIIGVSQAPKF